MQVQPCSCTRPAPRSCSWGLCRAGRSAVAGAGRYAVCNLFCDMMLETSGIGGCARALRAAIHEAAPTLASLEPSYQVLRSIMTSKHACVRLDLTQESCRAK